MRCILHIDLDGFYAQAEAYRLGVPRGVPLAVTQWGRVIAANYAAKAFGLPRGSTEAQARERCPSIRLVEVETVDASGGTATAHGERKVSLERYRIISQEVFSVFARELGAERLEKASIDEFFFDASELVSARLTGPSTVKEPGPPAEASALPGPVVDEAGEMPREWVVVGLNDKHVAGCSKGPGDRPRVSLVGLDAASSRIFDPDRRRSDRILLEGMKVAARARKAVLDSMGFTCSAGVAHNKLLAKLASAMHKPAQQTLVPAGAVMALMRTVPLRALRGMGGKLGRRVSLLISPQDASHGQSSSSVSHASSSEGWRGKHGPDESLMAGDLHDVPLARLQAEVGAQNGTWVHQRVRGECDEPVEARVANKSLLAAKSFAPIHTVSEAWHWLRLLCAEFAPRLIRDRQEQQRRASGLTLHFRPGGMRGQQMRSVSAPVQSSLDVAVERALSASSSRPLASSAKAALAALADSRGDSELVEALLRSIKPLVAKASEKGMLPCTRIALSAHSFMPVAKRGRSIADRLRAMHPGAAGSEGYGERDDSKEMTSRAHPAPPPQAARPWHPGPGPSALARPPPSNTPAVAAKRPRKKGHLQAKIDAFAVPAPQVVHTAPRRKQQPSAAGKPTLRDFFSRG